MTSRPNDGSECTHIPARALSYSAKLGVLLQCALKDIEQVCVDCVASLFDFGMCQFHALHGV